MFFQTNDLDMWMCRSKYCPLCLLVEEMWPKPRGKSIRLLSPAMICPGSTQEKKFWWVSAGEELMVGCGVIVGYIRWDCDWSDVDWEVKGA